MSVNIAYFKTTIADEVNEWFYLFKSDKKMESDMKDFEKKLKANKNASMSKYTIMKNVELDQKDRINDRQFFLSFALCETEEGSNYMLTIDFDRTKPDIEYMTFPVNTFVNMTTTPK